jgi:predicted lactoylglutathione lyase
MNLGTYVEIKLKSKNIDKSMSFYEYLGFRKIGDDVMTDGSINIRLSDENFTNPTLSYMGTKDDMVQAIFKNQKQSANKVQNAEFKSLNGLTVSINRDKSKVKMPAGTPVTRTPISRLGKFGEFSIPVKDVAKAIMFWAKLGFEPLHIAKIPYQYSIMSDGLIVIGLHQSGDFDDFTFTYFANDMQARVADLAEEGLDMKPMKSDVDATIYENAWFLSPEGQQFFLFKGEL